MSAESTHKGRLRVTEIDAALGGSTILMSENGKTHFRCFSCGQKFRWSPEVSGRTIRCPCGEKVRCPLPHEQTMTAGASLDDTVADVELEEHLDQIAASATGDADEIDEEIAFCRIPQKGMFGWPIGGEVMVWGMATLVGLALGILAAIVREHFLAYTVGFVLIFPYSAYRLKKAWPRWAQGRPWTECIATAMGAADDDEPSSGEPGKNDTAP